MEEKIITSEVISGFEAHLVSKERSGHTIAKYLHDVRAYAGFLGGREVSSETTCGFKQELIAKEYAPGSINTMLASLFAFFKFMGWTDCGTQRMLIQRDAYCPEDKELTREDYEALLGAARERDRLIMETVCSTGIRVSELRFFTLEAVKSREVVVTCKRKIRHIMVPDDTALELERYAEKSGITSGVIFRGRNGKPLDRLRVWAVVKLAAVRAKVKAAKAFPHNLRKLFARTFYDANHDAVKLADVLGHSSIETTRIYTRSSGAEHRKLVNALGLVPHRFEPPAKQKPLRTHRGRRGKRAKKINATLLI